MEFSVAAMVRVVVMSDVVDVVRCVVDVGARGKSGIEVGMIKPFKSVE